MTTVARKKRSDKRISRQQDDRLELRPRSFVPRACSCCQADRPPGTSYSKVYATKGRIRYCRCHYCGNTWTQAVSAEQITTGMVNDHAVVISKDAGPVHAKEHGNNGKSTGTD